MVVATAVVANVTAATIANIQNIAFVFIWEHYDANY
jgi:hypothetical protein